jgi:GNAT superfamily N-acetyltransferase
MDVLRTDDVGGLFCGWQGDVRRQRARGLISTTSAGGAMASTERGGAASHPTSTSDIALRQAEPADMPAIGHIWATAWRDGHLGHVPDALAAVRTAESFFQRAGERLGDTVVAVIADEVAGFVMVVGDEVEQVYVAARYRGLGTADVLLAAAGRLVAAQGRLRVWARCRSRQRPGATRLRPPRLAR